MAGSSLDADDVRAVPPGIPRWVKVSALVVAALIVVVLAVMLLAGGDHGPGRHLSLAPVDKLSATELAAASLGWAG